MAEDWSPRGDRMLALLPAERPEAFDRLPFEEQQWRGRVFLMLYTSTGSERFSWATALKSETNDDEAKAFVATVDDNEIAFRVSEASQGRWYGPPEAPVAPTA